MCIRDRSLSITFAKKLGLKEIVNKNANRSAPNKKPPIDVKNLITFLPPVFVLFHLCLNPTFYLFFWVQIQSYYLKNSLDQ